MARPKTSHKTRQQGKQFHVTGLREIETLLFPTIVLFLARRAYAG
jgi:hypothetical protein